VPVEEEVVLGDLDEQGVMDGSPRDMIEPENDPFAVNAPPGNTPARPPQYSAPAAAPRQVIPPTQTETQTPRQTPGYAQQTPAQSYGYVPVESRPVQRPSPPGWITGPQAVIQ
jgi:hypothetical protein